MSLFSQIFIGQKEVSKKLKDISFIITLIASILIPVTNYSITLFTLSGVLCFLGTALDKFTNLK